VQFTVAIAFGTLFGEQPIDAQFSAKNLGCQFDRFSPVARTPRTLLVFLDLELIATPMKR
jgi:hypothetical protein